MSKATRWIPPTPAANPKAELQRMKCSKKPGTHFLRAETFFSQTNAKPTRTWGFWHWNCLFLSPESGTGALE